ncbi:MAG: hypothetical protein KDD47_28085, partial [Acidobacteria bacterium]|nr:hypothetical protein [Acidobacteriota bacterium]
MGPAGDQFSFCVALYECLFGRRPFAAESASSYLQEVEDASLPELAQKGVGCPRWLRQALRRGLARDPAERFPSMDALLARIALEPRRRRWLGVAATAAVAAATVAFLVRGSSPEPPTCAGGEERVLQVWNPGKGREVKASFAATGVPFAGEAFERVEGLLDGYARDWVAGYTAACEATHLLGEQSGDVLDLRMACLDQRRMELGALVELFSTADATVVSRAPRSAESLTQLATCADRTELALQPPPPRGAASRAKISGVRADVASQRARKALGLGVDFEVARRAVTSVKATGYRLLEAEALRLLGLAHQEQGDYPAAEESFHGALWAAMAAGDRVLQLQIYHLLMNLAAYYEGDGAKAERWARFADAALEPLRLRYRQVEAEHYNARGLLSRVLHDGRERSYFEKAVELSKDLPEVRRAHRIAYLNNLALCSPADEGIALLEQSIVLTEADGSANPLLVMPLVNLASLQAASGRHLPALANAERALRIHEGFFGKGHRDQVYALLSVGQIHVRLDQPEEALAYLEQASELAARTWSEQHELVVLIEQALGEFALQRDELDAADRHFAAAGAALPASYSSGHPLSSSVRASLCQLELRREAWPQLLELVEEAWKVGEEQGWGEERDRWWVMIALGRARFETRVDRESVELLERAVEAVPADSAPSIAAEARLELAKVLLSSNPGRAVGLAREAVGLLGGDSAVRRRRQGQIRHWLEQLEGTGSPEDNLGGETGASTPLLGFVPLDPAAQGAARDSQLFRRPDLVADATAERLFHRTALDLGKLQGARRPLEIGFCRDAGRPNPRPGRLPGNGL